MLIFFRQHCLSFLSQLCIIYLMFGILHLNGLLVCSFRRMSLLRRRGKESSTAWMPFVRRVPFSLGKVLVRKNDTTGEVQELGAEFSEGDTRGVCSVWTASQTEPRARNVATSGVPEVTPQS